MKLLLRYLSILLLICLAFLFYFSYYGQISYPYQPGPELDKHVRTKFLDRVNEMQPDIVLMGDSMLQRGVDADKLAEGLDKKVLDIALPGSSSTLWYLILKNNILRSPTPPAYLIIFFRDSELTVPGLRVQGKYLEQIDEYASPRDRLLIQRAFVTPMNPIELAAEKFLPPFHFRLQTRTALDSYIRYLLPTHVLGCSETCTDQAMVDLFQGDNMEPNILSNAIDASDDYLYSHKSLDFPHQVDISFLPEFVRLCKENHIQLVAVHMKTLRFIKENSIPPAVLTYRKDIKAYFQQNDVIYLDFSTDSRIPDSGLCGCAASFNGGQEVIYQTVHTGACALPALKKKCVSSENQIPNTRWPISTAVSVTVILSTSLKGKDSDQRRAQRHPGERQHETRDRPAEGTNPNVDGEDKDGQQPAADEYAQGTGNALFPGPGQFRRGDAATDDIGDPISATHDHQRRDTDQ